MKTDAECGACRHARAAGQSQMAQPLRAAPISVPIDASIAESSGSGFLQRIGQ
ncbi:hypothetical protein NY751_06355 [Xanthomonas campestris]|uniref:hypothetical protein n=1 Tax=Xanthomonas campestris TaxID=339 RepID=UPI00235A4033|nr:hypothetical protein [Xanthomonas campestris]MDC8745718.1 hypothetical protein [Xanthomonas campestris]